jgi:hypothetical protein
MIRGVAWGLWTTARTTPVGDHRLCRVVDALTILVVNVRIRAGSRIGVMIPGRDLMAGVVMGVTTNATSAEDGSHSTLNAPPVSPPHVGGMQGEVSCINRTLGPCWVIFSWECAVGDTRLGNLHRAGTSQTMYI